jgi:hypothetical protein
MSKSWFLEIALEAPPSPLAGTIASILSTKDAFTGGVSLKLESDSPAPETTPSEVVVSASPSISH